MKVTVTRAQVEAAKLLVERARQTGQPVERAIRLIAEAAPSSEGPSAASAVGPAQ